MLVGEVDADQAAAERGEGSGAGMKRREEGRVGRGGESIEMQTSPGVNRRSVSRQ